MSFNNLSNFSYEEYFQFLHVLYESSHDQENHSVSLWNLAQRLQYSRTDAQNIADELQNKSLLTYVSLSGNVQLTSLGRFEIMLALSRPDKSTRLFPAISEFSNSEFTKATMNYEELTNFLTHLKDFSTELGLNGDTSDQLSCVFDRLDTVLKADNMAPKPTEQVLHELHIIDNLLNSSPQDIK